MNEKTCCYGQLRAIVAAMTRLGKGSQRVVAMMVAGVCTLVLGFTIGVACDSNPTPHPSNQGDDAMVLDTATGGGGETADPGFGNETDPDMADAMTPTDMGDVVDGDGGDGDAVEGDVVDVDAGDAVDADHNETRAADGT